jgi:DNA-binding SARP family transcriptional activator/TolB-like protein
MDIADADRARPSPHAEHPPGTAPAGPILRLATLGRMVLSTASGDIAMPNRKSQALIAYLATVTHGRETRERVAGLLWSEHDEVKARASLRQTIADVKRVLEATDPALFTADRIGMRLDLDRVTTDFNEITDALEDGILPAPLLEERRLAERFLEGLEDLDPAFRSWLMVQRQRLQDRLINRLEAFLEGARDPLTIRRIGGALLNLEPTHEVGCQAVIRACAIVGDIAGALKAYRQLWDLLDQDFDAEPSEKTQDLIRAVKLGQVGQLGYARGTVPPAPVLRNAVAIARPSEFAPEGAARVAVGHAIVVAGFAMEQLSPDRQALVRAFRHHLVASLVCFRGWSVIDGDDPVARSHADDSYRMEATVFDEEDRLRFVMTLKDAGDGRFLWSEQFVSSADDWMRTRAHVVRRVAGALDINLSTARVARAADIDETLLSLHDRWLRGRAYMYRWRPDEEAKAEAVFRGLIEEAPYFAPAYASLVGILNSRHLVYPGVERNAALHAEALELAKIAVQLDPLDTRCQLCLGWSQALNGSGDRAGLAFQLACDVNPNDPWTLVSAALGLAYCGEAKRARSYADTALDLGLGISRLHWAYQASTRFVLGDYEATVEAAENAGDALVHIGGLRAAALALAGRRDEGRREGRRFVETIAEHWFGEGRPAEADVSRWLLGSLPIASKVAREELRNGLEMAGLSPPDLAAVPLHPVRDGSFARG